MRRTTDLAAAFARAPLLGLLPEAVRHSLAGATRVVELRTSELLWREGDAAKFLGLVVQGSLAVERSRRRAVMVDVVGAGQLLGEVGFALDARYQFDVRCLRLARVALIPSAQLRLALTRSVEASSSLAFDLAQQVLRLSRRVETLSSGAVSQRLARVLTGLAERFGEPFPGGTLLPVRLRREDLAAMAATTLESASRQISAWTRAGLLVPQPAGFLLRDLEALHLAGEDRVEETPRPKRKRRATRG
jgi:CRP-like cAMP-binding protein